MMKENGVNFTLCQDDGGNLLWRGPLSVLGHYHGDVRLVYSEDFPDEPMIVYVFEPRLPTVNVHIHYDGSICYILPEEWYSDWNAYWVYLSTIRFLHDFYSGKMGNYPSTYSPRSGFLGWLSELFGL